MQIKINNDQYLKARDFARSRLLGSKKLYEYRGEVKEDKIFNDIVIGVMGEFAAAAYLRKKGYTKVTRPDLKIYEGKRKNYSADLTCNHGKDLLDIHVKSQGLTSAKRYGNSWLLQKSDKITKDPGENEYILFTNVDLEARIVTVLGVSKMEDIISQGLLDECRVPRYRHSKYALYFKDIEKKINTEVL